MLPREPLLVRSYASAGGVVVDAMGEHVLVLLRRGRLGPNGLPELRLPKGHIEPGESAHDAACREILEEAGLSGLVTVASLGQQTVEFDRQAVRVVRDEACFLMIWARATEPKDPEPQFECHWLPWLQALRALTFESEREWVRRAIRMWAGAGRLSSATTTAYGSEEASGAIETPPQTR